MKAWFPVDQYSELGLGKSDWILRALTESTDNPLTHSKYRVKCWKAGSGAHLEEVGSQWGSALERGDLSSSPFCLDWFLATARWAASVQPSAMTQEFHHRWENKRASWLRIRLLKLWGKPIFLPFRLFLLVVKYWDTVQYSRQAGHSLSSRHFMRAKGLVPLWDNLCCSKYYLWFLLHFRSSSSKLKDTKPSCY